MKRLAESPIAQAFTVVGILALLAVMFLGAAAEMKRTTGGPSGRILWAEESIVDADGTFNTSAFNLEESTTANMSLVVTDIKGAAPKVDCAIYSGTNATTGASAAVSFTQITAKGSEMKSITTGKFHPYIWAVCTGTGTISTVTLTVQTSGKP